MGGSAFLVFWLQPLLAKAYLPSFGGTPAVWATSLCLYQILLWLGYLYAAFLQRLRHPQAQIAVHLGCWLLGLFYLPSEIVIALRPEGATWAWLSQSLVKQIGLPFFWLSATAPLLQAWFATRQPESDPYPLYRASNLGSFAALLAFPFLLEPRFALSQQWLFWRYAYLAGGGLLLLCASLRLSRAISYPTTCEATPSASPLPRKESSEEEIGKPHQWLFFALIPSALLVSMTQHITTDIAAAPLLWMLPLALFLGTFVRAFSLRPLETSFLMRAHGYLLAPLLLLWLSEARLPWWIEMPCYLGGFWCAALACHHRLMSLRPTATELTRFYGWMATGGALGGLAASLLAPLCFSKTWELPLLLLASHLALPWRPTEIASLDRAQRASRRASTRYHLAWFLLCFSLSPLGLLGGDQRLALSWAMLCLLCMVLPLGGLLFRMMPKGWVLALCLLALWGGRFALDSSTLLVEKRGFFGTMRVQKDPKGRAHLFFHGRTLHGLQALPLQEGSPEPLAYFSRQSPIGQYFAATQDAPPRHICIFGLGIGTLAAYGRQGDLLRFFEIDPLVAQIAKDPRFFRFLSQSPARLDIQIGDARNLLHRLPDHSIDLFIQDAFSSDSIPSHLLTTEAFALYLQKLKPRGHLLFHITNHFIDLEGLLAEHAAMLRLHGRIQAHHPPASTALLFPSRWVLLSPSPLSLPLSPAWKTLQRQKGFRLWRDHFSDLLSVLRLSPPSHARPAPQRPLPTKKK
jgi:spermidine synthase